MTGWRRVIAADALAAGRDEARERLRARRRRADGFATELPPLPDGEIWEWEAPGARITLWLVHEDTRTLLGDAVLSGVAAEEAWAQLIALADGQGWTGEVVFSTFRGDEEIARLAAVTGANRVATKMQRSTAEPTAVATGTDLIRPEAMSQTAFDDYLSVSVDGYARELLASGAATDADAARADAQESMTRLLPQGRDTPDQVLWTVLDTEGAPAGLLWLHLGREHAFIYDIEMRPETRGRGFGTQTLRFAVEQAREAGRPVIALNVFGHNDGARRLYVREGFVETEVVWAAALPG